MKEFLIFKVLFTGAVLALAFFELYRTRRDLAKMRAERLAREAAEVTALPVPSERVAAEQDDPREVANG